MIDRSGGKLSLENNYGSQPECNGSYYQGAIHNVSLSIIYIQNEGFEF